MVNAEKHKKLKYKFGMLPVDDREFMNKFCKKIVDDTNKKPEITIDGLNSLYDELNIIYDSFADKSGAVLKITSCQRVLEIYEWVYITKETIQFNYHMLTIDADTIKSILNECDKCLSAFKDIQSRQNKNIDNKVYGGIFTIKELASDTDDYLSDNFENIIRLKEPINAVGVDGLL